MLLLSLFPGIDLLGRGFEQEGFCIVRGPDLIYGGDIKTFHPPGGRFEGIIAGSPCQDFSIARHCVPPTGEGKKMLEEFGRVVLEASPAWFLLENVPAVPDVEIEGFTVQRFDLNANECGLPQDRLRHFQFGSKDRLIIRPERGKPIPSSQRACVATEGVREGRRTWADFCELQGLPRDFSLPGLTLSARYRAVGNGVPVPVARTIARAILSARPLAAHEKLCACGCGRVCTGKQLCATPACRKRLERLRRGARETVTARCSAAVAGSHIEM
jgi:DNA (cytosine-5)-methyltransferase 1